MSDLSPQRRSSSAQLPGHGNPSNLADVLERVLDKGIVIVGDIRVQLLDIELLTIKIKLLVASVDRAREMGINWWESQEYGAPELTGGRDDSKGGDAAELRERLQQLEDRVHQLSGPPDARE